VLVAGRLDDLMAVDEKMYVIMMIGDDDDDDDGDDDLSDPVVR